MEEVGVEGLGRVFEERYMVERGQWLTYCAFLQECDEPVLEHLTDIKVAYVDTKGLVSASLDPSHIVHMWLPLIVYTLT